MDYYLLTEVAADLGYELAMSGAETYRVEESITRVLGTYGIESEVFAIPNCLHVSFETDSRKPLTRMRRIGFHGTNLEAVERYNALSRRICAEKPDPQTARKWLTETKSTIRSFGLWGMLFAHFVGSFGFSLFFGGSAIDGIWAGICGFVVYFVNKLMDDLKTNPFFSTTASSFAMALVAYIIAALGLTPNVDTVIIGTLMLLVPGLLFTNSLRDIMARIRKYPAITYLVVSLFPLLPGAGIYYTSAYIVQKNSEMAMAKGVETAGIAGAIAVGILLVSTAVRLFYTLKSRRKH